MTGDRAHRARGRRKCRLLLAMLTGLVSGACGVTDEAALPPDVQDPATVQTASGAMAFYQRVVATVPEIVVDLVPIGGILSDELAALPLRPLTSGTHTQLDSRQDGRIAEFLHAELHRLRAQAQEARGFLTTYAADSSPALRGHLYALEGYAEVYLADLFCSGIPLSRVDFGGDYTLAAGSTTAEVYAHASALFDTARTLTDDSLRLQHLAAIGRGRALLAGGDYEAAADEVHGVPTEYVYQVTFGLGGPARGLQAFAEIYGNEVHGRGTPSMADREGLNGLTYRASADPRAPFLAFDVPDPQGSILYFPAKYPVSGPTAFTIASGIEARLIEAEAALRADPEGGVWLQQLNALRQTVGLADTTDPGVVTARVDLMFRERAFWLYLTAHRQGDLRRLIREYGRAPNTVYPTGTYPGGNGAYGDEIVVRVPASEQDFNPKYGGCFHRNA